MAPSAFSIGSGSFVGGGWDSYSMFGPVSTRNHASLTFAAGALNPTPAWSDQRYRPPGHPTADNYVVGAPQAGLTVGHLALDGRELFPDLCVVSSHVSKPSHSTGRWFCHYGEGERYFPIQGKREPHERTYHQAFSEAFGALLPVSNITWHR